MFFLSLFLVVLAGMCYDARCCVSRRVYSWRRYDICLCTHTHTYIRSHTCSHIPALVLNYTHARTRTLTYPFIHADMPSLLSPLPFPPLTAAAAYFSWLYRRLYFLHLCLFRLVSLILSVNHCSKYWSLQITSAPHS